METLCGVGLCDVHFPGFFSIAEVACEVCVYVVFLRELQKYCDLCYGST